MMNIKAIVVIQKAKVLERGGIFGRKLKALANATIKVLGNGFSSTSKGEIINLSEKEDGVARPSASIDGTVVSGGSQLKLRREENLVDMFFPKAARFRMALQGMENGEDKGSIQFDSKAVFIPVSIGIINVDKSWSFRRRTVGKCISSIASKDLETFVGSQGKEQPLDVLINTRGVTLGHSMKDWSCSGRSITTTARSACAISFNMILPMNTKYNGIVRFGNWFSKHSKRVHAVKLLELASLPFRPSIQLAKLSASEVSKSLLFWSGCGRTDGLDCSGNGFGRDGSGREVQIGKAD